MRKFNMRKVENLDPNEPLVKALERLRDKMAARSAQKAAGTYSESGPANRLSGPAEPDEIDLPLKNNKTVLRDALRAARHTDASLLEEDQDGAD